MTEEELETARSYRKMRLKCLQNGKTMKELNMSSGDYDKKKCPNCGNYKRISNLSATGNCLACGTEIVKSKYNNPSAGETKKSTSISRDLSCERSEVPQNTLFTSSGPAELWVETVTEEQEDKQKTALRVLVRAQKNYEEARKGLADKGIYDQAFICDVSARAIKEAIDIVYDVFYKRGTLHDVL